MAYANLKRNLRDDGFTPEFQANAISSPNVLALLKSPFVAPYDFSTDGKISTFVSDADDYLAEALGSKASLANPLGILKYADALNKNRVDNTDVNIVVTPVWHINRNFTIQEQFAYSQLSCSEIYYTPVQGMPNYYVKNIGTVQNSTGTSFYKHKALSSDTRFDLALPLGKHRLDIFGGVRYLNDNFKNSYTHAYDSGNDKTPDKATRNKHAEGVDETWKSINWYANIDYNYREKYYLQGSFAFQSSSRFGKDADAGIKLFGVTWGFFPSIQGAWVISNENWFRPSRGVNMLKLNAGFESLGNDSYDNNAAFTYMSARSFLKEKGN